MSWLVLLPLLLMGPAALADAGAGGASVAPAAPAGSDAGAAPLLAIVDETAREVAALRGIPVGAGPLPTAVVGRDEARRQLERMLRRQLAPGELEMETRTLQTLGLLARGADYVGLMLDAAVQDMAGFYDPSARRLFVANWVPPEQQRPVLAHEIEHALQDRRWGLEKLLGLGAGRSFDSDAQLALQALAEGDATVVMMELMDPAGAFAGARALAEALRRAGELPPSAGRQREIPRFLRETMMFPYLDGLQFVMRVRSRRPWSGVDALWQRPPESTEQILHPEKYDCREAPVKIETAALEVGAGHRELGADTVGELVMRIWLAAANPGDRAERAAAGWGGDRLVAYDVGGGGTMLAWLTVWDSEADAEDFATAAAQSLAALARTSGAGTGAGQLLTFTSPEGVTHALSRDGARVALLVGGPLAPDHLVRQMLDGWRVTRPRVTGTCPGEEPAGPAVKRSRPASAPSERRPGARR